MDSGPHLLFIYGTLKRGFPNHPHMPSSAQFLSSATTVAPMPLVVGTYGIPFLLRQDSDDSHASAAPPHCVQGEVWAADADALATLDEFEGASAGFYDRIAIQVTIHGQRTGPATAWTYVRSKCGAGPHWIRAWPAERMRSQLPCLPSYAQEQASRFVARDDRAS